MPTSSWPLLRLSAERDKLVCLLRLPRPAGGRRFAVILVPTVPHLRCLRLLPIGGGDEPSRAA